jgi:hypothetical protein
MYGHRPVGTKKSSQTLGFVYIVVTVIFLVIYHELVIAVYNTGLHLLTHFHIIDKLAYIVTGSLSLSLLNYNLLGEVDS